MKTLSIVNVMSSATVTNAATVVFRLGTDICTVDVTEIPTLGQAMTKYYGTGSKMHPVARNEKGHFVSIKGYEEQLIEVALKSGWIVTSDTYLADCEEQGRQDLAEQDADDIVQPLEVVLEEVAEFILDKPKAIGLVQRSDRANLVGVTDLIKEPEVALVHEPIVEEDHSVELTQDWHEADAFYSQDDMDFALERDAQAFLDSVVGMDNVIYTNPEDFHMQEVKATIQVDDIKPETTQEVVKKACRITYNFFQNELRVNTVNPNQMEKLLKIIWNVNVCLHPHADAVRYFVLDYVMYEYKRALGNSKFMMKEKLQNVVREALKESVAMAAAQAC